MDKKCSCEGLRPGMTYEELLYVKNCCENLQHPYICPALDKERRRAHADRERKEQYKKRLKKQGLSDEEISQRKPRSGRQPRKFNKVDLDEA